MSGRDVLLFQTGGGSGFQSCKLPVESCEVKLVLAMDCGDQKVIPDVSHQKAQCTAQARVGGHHHGGDFKELGQSAGVQRPGAAQGKQSEVVRVPAPTHRNLANRVAHVECRDLNNSLGSIHC